MVSASTRPRPSASSAGLSPALPLPVRVRGLDVDDGLGQLGQLLVRLRFLVERCLEQVGRSARIGPKVRRPEVVGSKGLWDLGERHRRCPLNHGVEFVAYRTFFGETTMGIILLIVLAVLLFGSVPAYPYSRGWGYAPSGLAGLLLVILLVLLFFDVVNLGFGLAHPWQRPVVVRVYRVP
jgi:uncharacterized protein DUF3309